MGLFSKKAAPHATREELARRLVESVNRHDYTQVEKLIDGGANPNLPMEEGPLQMAVERGDEQMVRLLLDKGASPDVQVGSDSTLLMIAFGTWRSGIIDMLIRKADPNFKAKNGATPLIYAIKYGRGEQVQEMIARGADPLMAGPDGQLPIHAAAYRPFPEILGILLEAAGGAIDINAPDNKGKTPLHIAAENDYASTALFLLEKGADPDRRDHDNKTPAEHAEAKNKALASVLRGEIPGPRTPSDGWVLLAQDEVARVTRKQKVGYRVTEIFNFSARTYTQVMRNFDTGMESQAVKSFDTLAGGALLKEAHEALLRLGGHAAGEGLGKRKLAQPGGNA